MGYIAQLTTILIPDWIQNYFTVKWVISVLFLCGIIYDQISYISKKGCISGPRIKLWPVIGPYLASMNPRFEDYKTQWAAGPLSCISIFHKFVVFGSARDLAWKGLNSPKYLKPCLVDSATKILRPTNWVFLDAKAHVRYRRSLSHLFTREALQVYLPLQEDIYDEYMERWVVFSEKHGPRKYLWEFRYLNCAVALKTFCGSYFSEDQFKSISENYYRVSDALDLVTFPIILPYTKAWHGRKVADMIMNILAQCAQRSKHKIGSGGKPDCVMDSWVKSMLDSDNLNNFSNKEISETVFSFLFAGQDTTTSAVTWLFQLLADRPDVIKKIRSEQLAVRQGDINQPINLDMVNRMSYTEMVVKESIRYRPPVVMVPYIAKDDFQITKDYTIPKGSMFIPSFYPALHDPDVYHEPEKFSPERWVQGSKASTSHRNWLAFGSGSHRCIGQEFVMIHLTALIGRASMLYDWKHIVTPQSEKIRICANIFPDDDCILEFSKRHNS